MAESKRPRSRAGLFLALYVLFSMSTARVIANAQSGAEKFGAALVPLTCLAIGTYLAFKSGGRAAKVLASLLVGALLVPFAVGLRSGYQRHTTQARLEAETQDLLAGISLDVANGLSLEEQRIQREARARAAARRLQASDESHTAELGRAMELSAGLMSESDARFAAAVEVLGDARLLDLDTMLEDRAFEWRRAALEEYAAASREAKRATESLPERLRALAHREGFSQDIAELMLTGVPETQPHAVEIWSAHEDIAQGYLVWVELVERHADTLAWTEDGGLDFGDEATNKEYVRCWERIDASFDRMQAAGEGLQDATDV